MFLYKHLYFQKSKEQQEVLLPLFSHYKVKKFEKIEVTNPPAGGSKRKKSETVDDEKTLNEMNLNLQKQMMDLKKRSDLNDKSIKPEDYTKATFDFIV